MGELNNLFKNKITNMMTEANNTSIFKTGMVPVTPVIFFRDWMKSPLFPIQQEAVDNILVKDINGQLEWDTQFNECYLLWGMGSGKDFTISRTFAYALYYLLCLKNPQEYFKLGNSTEPIDLVNVSFDEDQAQFVFFKKLKMALASVRRPGSVNNWFEEQKMQIKETSKSQVITFPSNITCYSLNSKEYKVEGKNCLLALFDEMAVFRPDKADELYKILKGNMTSRFPNAHKFIAISYKRDDHDYMMVKWEETKGDPRVYRSGPHSTWDVNTLKTKADFDDAFRKDPEDAERRYQCIGETSKSGYFKYREKIKEHINKERQSPIIEEQVPIRDILGIKWHDSFVGNPNYNYVAHIDLAKGKDTENETADCAGFAMGHRESLDGVTTKIVIDLMVQFKAERGKEIIFEHVRQFINYLLSVRHFNIKLLTLDGYQSTDFMQIMRGRGVESELLSVDRDTSAYDTLKSLLYNKMLDYYGYRVFIRECEELKLVNGKVDHPDKSMRRALEEQDDRGSKDVSDCVASICKTLIMQQDGQTRWLPLDSRDGGHVKEVRDINSREVDSKYRYVNDYTDDDDDD